jgi:hypothetical protein
MSDDETVLRARYRDLRSAALDASLSTGAMNAAAAAEQQLRDLYTATGRDLKPLENWLREVDISMISHFGGA